MARRAVTYESAGVSIATADRLVEYLKTKNKAIGGFSGLFPLSIKGFKRPLLVASTDGVGTKLLIAKQMRRLDTIGVDLVAMVVNDLITCGAQPLFFLDYYATGKLRVAEARAVLEGIFRGCEEAGMMLLGGETAELPGLYASGDFDLAGFGVGVVDAASVLDGRKVEPGDLLFGVESSGLHSNGYSLARRVLLEIAGMKLSTRVRELGTTLGAALLTPTRIYARLVAQLRRAKVPLKACAHITGGGIPGNLVRVLPPTVDAVIYKNRWETPPIFKLIQRCGPVEYAEMLRTFNLGIGFIMIAEEGAQAKLLRTAKRLGERIHIVGHIEKGTGRVRVEVE